MKRASVELNEFEKQVIADFLSQEWSSFERYVSSLDEDAEAIYAKLTKNSDEAWYDWSRRTARLLCRRADQGIKHPLLTRPSHG